MQVDMEYIEKYDVIRRYHQHKLSDEELNSFEVYILEHPEIISVIEKEKILHDAFRENEPLLKQAARTGGISWTRGLAMAASVLFAVVAVFSYTSRQPAYDLQSPVILETFRGAGDNRIQVDGQPIVQFQVDMGPVQLLEGNAFTAELMDSNGNALFPATGLQVDADGWLFYILEGQDSVLAGDHLVRVYPDGNPAQAATFPVSFSSP